MQVSTINKSANFGYKFSENFLTAVENENFCYNILKLSKAKQKEKDDYNKLVEKIEQINSSDVLDINENGKIVLNDKEIESTYFNFNIGKCISYNSLKNIYEQLSKKGKCHAN